MSTPSLPKVFSKGNTAVITGGASGIGLALSRRCVEAGMNVIIADNNPENLKGARESLGGPGTVEVVEMDVGVLEGYERIVEILKAQGGSLNLLVLNAGIGPKGTWTDPTYFQKILSVNLFGVINGIASLLPYITRTAGEERGGETSIIITGSKQGITNPPGNPAYNASKSAVKTLAEHLSFDLSKSSPSTTTHLLIPGWTFTGLSGNSPFSSTTPKKPDGAWSPDQVVEYLLKKMGEGKFYIICPDNDVNEEMDKKRMLWGAEDLVKGRPPLTRWREEWKEENEKWMKETKI